MHSATKYLGGHGSAIAGVIVDGGNFDWTQGQFPGFTSPTPATTAWCIAELGPPAFALKARVQLLRDWVLRRRRSTPSWSLRAWRR